MDDAEVRHDYRELLLIVNDPGVEKSVVQCKATEENQVFTRVCVTPDLTYEVRERNRKLPDELMTRRGQDETNLIIKNGTRVQSDQPFHGGDGGPGVGGETED